MYMYSPFVNQWCPSRNLLLPGYAATCALVALLPALPCSMHVPRLWEQTLACQRSLQGSFPLLMRSGVMNPAGLMTQWMFSGDNAIPWWKICMWHIYIYMYIYIYIYIYIKYRSFLNPRWSTSQFVMLGTIGLRGFKNRLLLKDTKFSLRSCGFFCNSWNTFWNQQFFEKIENAWTSCLEHLEIYWIVLCRNTFRDFPKLLMFWSSIWPSAQKWTSKALESAFEITASVALNSVLLYSVGRRSAHVLICIFWVIFRLETTRGTFP